MQPTKWDSKAKSLGKRLAKREKLALLQSYETQMRQGQNREKILAELADNVGVGQRQIERILAQAAKYEHEIENHFAELSITALILASNFESYLDNGTGSGSTIGDVVYGGWLNDIDGILDALSVEMHEVDKSVALHLLCHLKEEFRELTDIKDWAELNNDKITKDFVERLRLRAYRGDFGKCPACPNC